ncbi:MAG: hypothetical protein H0W06_08000 [Chloroflexia bacterium]|nr:hypothetical protein [Chloroflexia bacterium]
MSDGSSTIVTRSKAGVAIRLTDERWRHVTAGHPELTTLRAQVLETLADPETIKQGDSGELLAARFYAQTPLTSKWLVVAYSEIDQTDGFLLTAYLARRLSARRTTLWKR